ncbi:MAG: heme o synthase [Patescibacteria group bacterium]|nr:heme o synthase [Patescibacteria group bacterium]
MREYLSLTKPGIVFGNAVAALAGFLLASGVHPVWERGIFMILFLACVIASACTFNNYFDRDIDARMERTKERSFVRGSVSVPLALFFACALIAIGLAGLLILTTLLAALIALVGFLSYLGLYSLWGKRRGPWGTLVGSISGATPPLVGYAAALGRLDAAAALLFIAMCAWQMPHFYAIAVRRLEEYRSAGIPTLPLRYGLARTKVSMLFYIALFTIAASLLTPLGYLGRSYFFFMWVVGLSWFLLCLRRAPDGGEALWARRVFLASLAILFLWCMALGVSAVLALP